MKNFLLQISSCPFYNFIYTDVIHWCCNKLELFFYRFWADHHMWKQNSGKFTGHGWVWKCFNTWSWQVASCSNNGSWLVCFSYSSLKDNSLICQNCIICPINYSSFHYFQVVTYSMTPIIWGVNVCSNRDICIMPKHIPLS